MKTGRRESRQTMTTARVLTLEGLKKLRDDLKGENAAQVEAEYRDAYFRDEHGSLRRIFLNSGRG